MKKILALFLVFALALSLTACGKTEPSKVDPIDSGKLEESSSSQVSSSAQESEPQPQLPADLANEDYQGLVENLSYAEAVCGVAYVGFVEGPFGDGYRGFIEEQTELMEVYSFVAEIPADRYVETDGYDLYCIVPTDKDCSVKVEEVYFPEETDAYEPVVGEIIYQSETGEPILLRCNESEIFSNALVTITTADGKEKSFSPYMSLMDGSLAGLNDDESGLLALDFSRTDASLEGFCTFDELIDGDWTCYIPFAEQPYMLSLDFYYDENGQQSVEFWYGPENAEIDEIFEGTVTENLDETGNWDGGYTMDMDLTGGFHYDGTPFSMVCSYKFQKLESDGSVIYAIHYGLEDPWFVGYEYQGFSFLDAVG